MDQNRDSYLDEQLFYRLPILIQRQLLDGQRRGDVRGQETVLGVDPTADIHYFYKERCLLCCFRTTVERKIQEMKVVVRLGLA